MSLTPVKNGDLYECEIDGRTFKFTKYDADQSTRLLLQMNRLFGRSMAAFANAVLAGKLQDSLGAKQGFEKAVALFSLGLSKDEEVTLSLLKKLSSERVLCGGPINFKTFYQDDETLAFKVAFVNLRVQFTRFSRAVGKLSEKFAAAKTNAQEETHSATSSSEPQPEPSTGSSGDA